MSALHNSCAIACACLLAIFATPAWAEPESPADGNPAGMPLPPGPPPAAPASLPGGGARAGEEKIIEVAPGTKITLRWCPSGKFTMGSPPEEKGRNDDESQHEVTLSHGFWLGKTEVTQGQWQAVMGSLHCHFQTGPALPVDAVSWDDAQAFCGKLNAKGLLPGGWKFALPTEAQWEYACRAGTTGDYAGDLDAMAWYSENSGKKTQPVATKKANAWGLHDMHGNVWECCADWFGDYPSGAATDPTGPSSGLYRVPRGGSWNGDGSCCRSAVRYRFTPEYRLYSLGFRLAAVPSPGGYGREAVPAGDGLVASPPAPDGVARQPSRPIALPPQLTGPARFFDFIGTSDAVALVEVTEANDAPPQLTGPARFHDLIGSSDAVVVGEVTDATDAPAPQPLPASTPVTPRRRIILPK